MSKFKVIIPARYKSVRFPGKPLVDIAGKPMVQRVYERALQSDADDVVIATDDDRISQVAKDFGATVCMTSDAPKSGTDRIAEAIDILNYPDDTVVVNVQGDEPLISPVVINQVANTLMAQDEAWVATLCQSLKSKEELFDPNVVKVILDNDGFGIYFSRAPIPWNRDDATFEDESLLQMGVYYRHLGTYAYSAKILRRIMKLESCSLEEIECLEQLRVLFYGGKICVGITDEVPSPSVDTPEDLKNLLANFDF